MEVLVTVEFWVTIILAMLVYITVYCIMILVWITKKARKLWGS
jgi:hypothetical protein